MGVQDMFNFSIGRAVSTLGAVLLAASGFASQAWSSTEVSKTNAPRTSAPEGLATVGRASLSWFGLDIYDATLWTETGDFAEPGFDQRLALRIDYHRTISSRKLAERTRKEWRRLDRHVRLPVDATVNEWLAALETMWPDVGPGDYIITIVEPGGQTRFEDSNGPLGVIEDPEFGPAFLSIWLHPRTSRPDLRMALVGDNGRRR